MMNAKELHDAFSANPTSGTELAVLAAANMSTILRALSLLAAAEANDGTTPETDAEADSAGRGTEFVYVPTYFARRLERERNGLARAHADALEENARLLAFRNYFADKCEGLFFQFGMEVIDLYNATHGREVCRIEPERAYLHEESE